MNSLILAALLALNPGYNNPGVAGEVVAIEAATSNATATVDLKSVQSFTTYTNATAQVIKYETAWRVTVTNFAPYVGWILPDQFFPVVGSYEGGTSDTITSMAGVDMIYNQGDEYIGMNVKGRDQNLASFTFAAGRSYYDSHSDYDTVTFGGADPVVGVSPYVEYVDQPASYVTNVVGYLDRSAFVWTNGVSTIVGEPVRFDMPITNTVVVATLPAATYAKTNDLASVTTSGHFGSVVTNGYLFGDGILVTGAADGDQIKLIYK